MSFPTSTLPIGKKNSTSPITRATSTRINTPYCTKRGRLALKKKTNAPRTANPNEIFVALRSPSARETNPKALKNTKIIRPIRRRKMVVNIIPIFTIQKPGFSISLILHVLKGMILEKILFLIRRNRVSQAQD